MAAFRAGRSILRALVRVTMQGDAASDDPNDPRRLAGAAFAAPARARERSAVRARRGGDEAQGAVHGARRQASGGHVSAPGGPLPARQPQGRLRESQLPRERVHREPERSRERPTAQVARVEDRSVELPGANGLRARRGEHPGRLAERAGRRRFRRAGVTVAVLDTGIAYRNKGTKSSTTPTCRRSRASSARRTSSTAISSRSTRTATAPTSRARSRRRPTTAGA